MRLLPFPAAALIGISRAPAAVVMSAALAAEAIVPPFSAVASARVRPVIPPPRMVSNAPGIVSVTKDPALATMRGRNIRKSFGDVDSYGIAVAMEELKALEVKVMIASETPEESIVEG